MQRTIDYGMPSSNGYICNRTPASSAKGTLWKTGKSSVRLYLLAIKGKAPSMKSHQYGCLNRIGSIPIPVDESVYIGKISLGLTPR